MTDSPADGRTIAIEGKAIASAKWGKTDKGYDYISLLFSDGSVFRIDATRHSGSLDFELIEP